MGKTYHNGNFHASTLPSRYFTGTKKMPRIGVMTVTETRLTNAKSLIEQSGSLDAFGDRIGMNNDNGQLSRTFGKKPIRKIGHKLARRIEAAFGRPEGWLDAPQGMGAKPTVAPQEATRSSHEIDQMRITMLAMLDVLTEMTPGAASALYDRLEIAVAPEYAEKGFHARVLSTLRNRVEREAKGLTASPPRGDHAPSRRKRAS